MNDVKQFFEIWKEKAVKDGDLIHELCAMENNDNEMTEAFYTNLEFGTAGLRGIIGAGTNRLNVYTIGKASQGLAAYINSINNNGSVAIAYDSRIKSDLFAKTAAEVFAANGVKVYIYKELMPTPMLSFAVRYLKCDAGVVVTASHNPSKYNGYKAYDSTGCQLCPEAADFVLDIMNKVDTFEGVKSLDFDEGIKSGKIEYISDDVYNAFLDSIENVRVSKDLDLSNLSVIYSPLHGTGNKPVRDILKRIGVSNVTVVKSEELPNGNFPTCPYPNPETPDAFVEAKKIAENNPADILIATDPDCDRVGIAVRNNGEYTLFSGNDVGVLMLNYILSRRKALGTLPQNPITVKTIVTTELVKNIANKYGCKVIEVLTGFKFIGEQITLLADNNESNRYVLGFEESYGYLAGDHARDKDAVVASMLICEMAAYYKSIGKNLAEVLEDIYNEFGFCYCVQKSFTFEGITGMAKIASIMDNLRNNVPKSISDIKVSVFKDFGISVSTDFDSGEKTEIELPKSNVLGFYLEDGSSVIVRPSGTEPKIKIYIGAIAETDKKATEKRATLLSYGTKLLGV
ncbi:MAG: phospho-sugar mutase [Clostridia bacterium]|nr:phospho-sugar mutase [Clostridia bacterium]